MSGPRTHHAALVLATLTACRSPAAVVVRPPSAPVAVVTPVVSPAVVAPPAAPLPAVVAVTPTPAAPAAPQATEASARPEELASARFRGREVEALLQAMRERRVLRMRRRFNARHPVFQLELEGGLIVGFRALARDRPNLFRNDLAGYALARLLGIEARVPPVAWRTVPMALLDVLPDDNLGQVAHVHPEMAYGSVIFWMPVLRPADVVNGPLALVWQSWLSQHHPLAEDTPPRAEELSTLLVFDALQGNTDRWHTGNLQTDERSVVVYRDNNEAWRSGGSTEPLRRLLVCERFSRALIEAVRRVGPDELSRALEGDAAFGVPVLRASDLARYERRRRRVLAHIDGLIARYGEARVLVWP